MFLFHFANAGINVTTDVFNGDVRAPGKQLSGTARAASANRGTTGELFKAQSMPTEQAVFGSFTFWNSGQRQSINGDGRQIFKTVDSQINITA